MVGQDVAIKAGRLFDGSGQPPLRDVVVLIEDSKIVRVGTQGEVEIPSSAQIVDASDKFVMPGLIDTHTHISKTSSPTSSTGWGVAEHPLVGWAVRSTAHVKWILESGVTTIRDMGSLGYIDIALRNAISDRIIVGPRIVASGKGLTCTGGHTDMLKHIKWFAHRVGPYPRALEEEIGSGTVVDGVSEILKAVRQQVKLGADYVKFWATGGVMEAEERAGAQEFSDEEIRAIVGEAKRARKPIAVHALTAEAIKTCIRAGVDTIEHGIFADEECVNMMKEEGIYLVPTLVAYRKLTRTDVGFPAAAVEVAKRAVAAHGKTLRMAKRASVKIAMGTDSGSPYGNMHGVCQAEELELMVSEGLTETETLTAATKTAAEAVKLEDKIGTIEEGKLADLIVLNGNPLKDIRIFQDKNRIELVMKDGKILVRRN